MAGRRFGDLCFRNPAHVSQNRLDQDQGMDGHRPRRLPSSTGDGFGPLHDVLLVAGCKNRCREIAVSDDIRQQAGSREQIKTPFQGQRDTRCAEDDWVADEGIDSASYSIQHVRFDFCFALALLTGISKEVSDQESLLEKLQSRTVFKKMEDGTALMIVHRDADLIPSHWTGTSISSSKRSISFGFDWELFASKIYERWIRGSVKKSLRQQQGDIGTRTERDRSQAIDRNIQNDLTRLRREFRVLALGSDSRHNIMNAFKVNYSGGYFRLERFQHKSIILQNVVENAKALIDAMEQLDNVPETEADWKHHEFLAAYDFRTEVPDSGFDPKFVDAVSSLWKDPYLNTVIEKQSDLFLDESVN
jgi:hypothetical protein